MSFRESADLVRKTAQERGYVAPVLLDASGDVTGKVYGVWGPPTAYLIDRQGRLVGLNLEAREVGGGPGAADGQQRQGQHDDGSPTDHEAVALTVFRTSAGSRRSRLLSMTFTNFTVPVLSMMKYARRA